MDFLDAGDMALAHGDNYGVFMKMAPWCKTVVYLVRKKYTKFMR